MYKAEARGLKTGSLAKRRRQHHFVADIRMPKFHSLPTVVTLGKLLNLSEARFSGNDKGSLPHRAIVQLAMYKVSRCARHTVSCPEVSVVIDVVVGLSEHYVGVW